MAGSSGGPDDAVFADINVTPLVDVTLVLLIILMVAAPLIAATPSIKVALPRASTADETQKSPLSLILQREPSGSVGLFVDGRRSDEPAVRKLIPALLQRTRELQAVIAADKGIAYGEVMRLVDLVKELGVTRFALLTETAP